MPFSQRSDMLAATLKATVIPAEAGIQRPLWCLDPGLRRDDAMAVIFRVALYPDL